MKVDEEILDRLFSGLPVYPERRYTLFHEAADAIGLRVFHTKEGIPFIIASKESETEIMDKLPKLKYERKEMPCDYFEIHPL